MAKRRFSIADGASPTRNVAPKIPSAASICIATSSRRPAKTPLRQSTCVRSGRPAVKNTLQKQRLGRLPLATAKSFFNKPSRAAGIRPRWSAGALPCAATSVAPTGQREPATLSVLDMLRRSARSQLAEPTASEHLHESVSLASPDGAPSPTAAERSTGAAAGADSGAAWARTAVLAVTRRIDDGHLELAGDPWVRPADLTRRAAAVHVRRRSDGGSAVSSEDVQSLALQPSVFVWAPDLLFTDLELACPSCGSEFSGARWHTSKPLHGLSSLHAYIARRYTCNECATGGSRAQRRRKEFVADAPALLDSLPDYVKTMWQLRSTGRTLCEATVVDFIRAMATRTSWSAIADTINEMRQTEWARSVTLPYYRLCARFSISDRTGEPAPPAAHRITERWVRNLYMADASRRRQEIQEELCAEKGDDVLVLDWTRDAAANAVVPGRR